MNISISKSNYRQLLLLMLMIFFGISVLASTIDSTKYREAITLSRSKVKEFQDLQKKADELGVRVWLFGGTAATFAHYVKGDLLQQESSYDYSFFNIFRSTQDIDLVVDGSDKNCEIFEEFASKLLRGSSEFLKPVEVRPLRKPFGDKYALLDDFGFRYQHSDSHSLMLIELSSSHEPVIRDAHQFNSLESRATQDILKNKISFFASNRHKQTPRFKNGNNPEIYAVIRYLIKAFQFNLQIDPAAHPKIKIIIQEFNPASINDDPSQSAWFERNVKKLFLHSFDIARSYLVLRQLGLLSKLRRIGNIENENSPARWAQRKPLPSFRVGSGRGATAKELGISIVAHDTRSYHLYEAITHSNPNIPNILMSRNGAPGEAAVSGDGFYTSVGKRGGLGLGITAQFELAPHARRGSDFILPSYSKGDKPRTGDHVVVLNRNALKVIRNTTKLEFMDFIRASIDQDYKEALGVLFERLKIQFSIWDSRSITTENRIAARNFIFRYYKSKRVMWRLHIPLQLNRQFKLFRISDFFNHIFEETKVVSLADENSLWQFFFLSEPKYLDQPKVISRFETLINEKRMHVNGIKTLLESLFTADPKMIKKIIEHPSWRSILYKYMLLEFENSEIPFVLRDQFINDSFLVLFDEEKTIEKVLSVIKGVRDPRKKSRLHTILINQLISLPNWRKNQKIFHYLKEFIIKNVENEDFYRSDLDEATFYSLMKSEVLQEDFKKDLVGFFIDDLFQRTISKDALQKLFIAFSTPYWITAHQGIVFETIKNKCLNQKVLLLATSNILTRNDWKELLLLSFNQSNPSLFISESFSFLKKEIVSSIKEAPLTESQTLKYFEIMNYLLALARSKDPVFQDSILGALKDLKSYSNAEKAALSVVNRFIQQWATNFPEDNVTPPYKRKNSVCPDIVKHFGGLI